MVWQRTIKDKIDCIGVGLHSGQRTKLEIIPAPADHGITFSRTDLSPHREIQAKFQNVVQTDLATTIGCGKHNVMTVEHLLAALVGMGVDNARIRVNGPEIPILDGSAAPFAFMISSVGTQSQRRAKRFAVITKTVSVQHQDKLARLSPAPRYHISCYISFRHPLVNEQKIEVDLSAGNFYREVARARTFGFLRDVEALKARGLARGGTLDNAVVVDDFSVLNEEGLRYPDEFVRHKALDAIGDLSLLGMPLIGHLEIYKSGHWLHSQLLNKLYEMQAFEIYETGEANDALTVDGRVLSLPIVQGV